MTARSSTNCADGGALVLVGMTWLQMFPVVLGTVATCLACVWYTIEIITWRTDRLAKQRAQRVKERETLARIENPVPIAAPELPAPVVIPVVVAVPPVEEKK